MFPSKRGHTGVCLPNTTGLHLFANDFRLGALKSGKGMQYLLFGKDHRLGNKADTQNREMEASTY
jgi:hypothetical protein